MNPEDYVSYPLALALKKHGFDEPCDRYYCAFDNETDVRFWSIHPAQSQNGLCTPQDKVVADAPTLAQAQKWLREVKRIEVNTSWESIKRYWFFYTNLMDVPDIVNLEDISDSVYSTYEQALSAGIAAALELIGEKGE